MWPEGITEQDRESLEERAAILEFDAKMPRDRAEQAALASWQMQRILLIERQLRTRPRNATVEPCLDPS